MKRIIATIAAAVLLAGCTYRPAGPPPEGEYRVETQVWEGGKLRLHRSFDGDLRAVLQAHREIVRAVETALAGFEGPMDGDY